MPARFPMTAPHNNPQGTAGSEQHATFTYTLRLKMDGQFPGAPDYDEWVISGDVYDFVKASYNALKLKKISDSDPLSHTSAPAPEPDEKCYIITEKMIKKVLSGHPWDEGMLRSLPHTPAPEQIPYKSCFGDFDDCPCEDECHVANFCMEYCKKKNVNSCGMTESQCGFVIESEKAEAAKAASEQAMKELLKDLQSFIDNADSHIGCPNGTLGTAYLVQWMGGQGWDCD